MMQALVQTRYGAPKDVLTWKTLPRPEPGRGQVRIRVHATSINGADYRLIRAAPFLARLARGLWRPKKWPVLGVDVAGVVDAVGEGVVRFQPGDEVWGDTFLDGLGGFAEWVCVQEGALSPKPPGASFEEAAALPLVGVTALQALRDKARVRPGHKLLIQGAGGGVGTTLVQMAHAMGAHVTAVCGPRSTTLVRELGADRVLDYNRTDPTAEGLAYDAILGVNGYHPLSAYKRSLKPGGTYTMIGGTTRQLFEALLLGKLMFLGSSKSAGPLTIDDSLRQRDLTELLELWQDGAVRPVIDRAFSFDDLIEALEYVERGHVSGKVVVQVREAQTVRVAA